MGKTIEKKEKMFTSKEMKEAIGKAIEEAKAHPEIPKCRIVICEDEKTGEQRAKGEGPCPEGYIEKVAIAVKKKGLTFEL